VLTSYEAFFGLAERPFSLTPDPKYFFKGRSHGRALETLTFGLRRREQFQLVTSEVGIGKTILSRTLACQLARHMRVSLVMNPLLTRGGLVRLLLEDLGPTTGDEVRRHTLGASTDQLHDWLVELLRNRGSKSPAVVVVDEAHTMPPALTEQLLSLAALTGEGEKLLQVILLGQPGSGEPATLGIPALDERVSINTRLLPLSREECGTYVAHRLRVAAGRAIATFTPRAIHVLYGLSGGSPRLVNLLCERALQESGAQGSYRVGPDMIEDAAAALDLLRTRPRRFRWFTKRVS
jgi:general secretion pathway protein A